MSIREVDSFVRLQGDTSILSQNCDYIGTQNQEGRQTVKVYASVLNDSSDNKRLALWGSKGFCDDPASSTDTAGTWKFFSW